MANQKPVTLIDVKQALRDSRFRDSLPAQFQDDMKKYVQNPGCSCNLAMYQRLIKEAKDSLQEYFPGRPIASLENELKKSKNSWTVINCAVEELEDKLRKLPPGRKQVAIARHENQVTVVVNEMDLI
jgi:hypothetical protein